MAFASALKRRWPWFAGGALVLLLAAGLIVAALAGVFAPASDDAAPRPTPTAEITPEPTPTPTPEPTPEVAIDSTGFMPYTPVWDPPDEGEGFWQIVDPDNGYPEDGGTDYVLAHACPDRECAGDHVRTLQAGDHLTYRGENYLVQDKLEISKDEIAAQDIWEHIPGRLVVVTCIIDPETGISNENDIIVATPAG